jgi:hypothetical protein
MVDMIIMTKPVNSVVDMDITRMVILINRTQSYSLYTFKNLT